MGGQTGLRCMGGQTGGGMGGQPGLSPFCLDLHCFALQEREEGGGLGGQPGLSPFCLDLLCFAGREG